MRQVLGLVPARSTVMQSQVGRVWWAWPPPTDEAGGDLSRRPPGASLQAWSRRRLGAGPGAPHAAPVPGGVLCVHLRYTAPVPPVPLGLGHQWTAWWVAGHWSRARQDPWATWSSPHLYPLLMQQWPRLAPAGSVRDTPLQWPGVPVSSRPGLRGQLVYVAAASDP